MLGPDLTGMDRSGFEACVVEGQDRNAGADSRIDWNVIEWPDALGKERTGAHE